MTVHRIERVHMYLCIDRRDDSEGMAAVRSPDGYPMPLFIADERRLEVLHFGAQSLIKTGGAPHAMHLVRYSGRETVDETTLILPTTTVPPWPGFRSTEMYAFICIDPQTGDESVPGVLMPHLGFQVPAIAADKFCLVSVKEQIEPLRAFVPMTLVRFTKREDL